MTLNPVSTTQPQESNWNELVKECKEIVIDIQMHHAYALMGYHKLGKIILAADLHGEQIDTLAKELSKVGTGFSRTNIYNCKKFAQRYPHFEAFIVKCKYRPWNQLIKLMVDHPRAKSNALDSQTDRQQPTVNSTTVVGEYVKLDPKTIQWYNIERSHGFQGDMSAFLNTCVEECYTFRYSRITNDGKIEYSTRPQ